VRPVHAPPPSGVPRLGRLAVKFRFLGQRCRHDPGEVVALDRLDNKAAGRAMPLVLAARGRDGGAPACIVNAASGRNCPIRLTEPSTSIRAANQEYRRTRCDRCRSLLRLAGPPRVAGRLIPQERDLAVRRRQPGRIPPVVVPRSHASKRPIPQTSPHAWPQGAHRAYDAPRSHDQLYCLLRS
jgi:hypothetical protein